MMRPLRFSSLVLPLMLALALAPAGSDAARAASPVAGEPLLAAELRLSMPEPTRTLQEIDHLASMAATVDLPLGPFRLSELVEAGKTLLTVDTVRLDLFRASGSTAETAVLSLLFREGFAARETAAPLLALLRAGFDIPADLLSFTPRATLVVELLGGTRTGTLEAAGGRLAAAWPLAGPPLPLSPLDPDAFERQARRPGRAPFFLCAGGGLPADALRRGEGGIDLPGIRSFTVAARSRGRSRAVEITASFELAEPPPADSWLAALARVRGARLEAALPSDTAFYAAAPLPGFAALARLPRGNALSLGLFVLGIDPERELSPLLEPELAFALRRESSPLDFLTGESEPSFALLLPARATAEAALDLFADRIAQAFDAAGELATSDVRTGGGRLRGFAMPSTGGFDLELFCAATGDAFAVGHGFDFGAAIAASAARGDSLAGRRRDPLRLLRGDPFVFRADLEALGPLLERRAAAVYGPLDRRTRDLRRFLRALRSVAGSAALRDGALVARLLFEGADR